MLGIALDGRVLKGSKSRCLTWSRSWRAVWVPESTEDRSEGSLSKPVRRAESIGTRGRIKWWQVYQTSQIPPGPSTGTRRCL